MDIKLRTQGNFKSSRVASAPTQKATQQPGDGDSNGLSEAELRIVDGFVSQPLKAGSTETLDLGDGKVITRTNVNNNPSLASRLVSGSATVLSATTSEVANIMNTDPSYSFKTIVETAEKSVTTGAFGDLKDAAKPYLPSFVRGGMLAWNTRTAISTYNNKDASRVEKAVDIGHVVTDVVGLAGTLGQAKILPFIPDSWSIAMAGVGMLGDLGALSFRAMGYVSEKSQTNFFGVYDSKMRKAPVQVPEPQEPQTSVA